MARRRSPSGAGTQAWYWDPSWSASATVPLGRGGPAEPPPLTGRLSGDGTTDEEAHDRALDDLIADLDIAILALLDQFEADVEALATLLDSVLQSSLWARTLARVDDESRKLQREVILSRAEWLW